MTASTDRYRWMVAFAVLVVFTVPWFLWRSDAVIAALPIWVWWFIGWMLVATAVFQRFSRRAWGLWIEEEV